MKKLFAFIGAICLMAGSASAYVTDAPHNETNNVSCGDCHTYSLWWQYSPATQDTTTGYAAIADSICNSCHDNKPGYPSKVGHTRASMGEDGHDILNGEWSTSCIDCHDPHQQAQIDWLSDSATWADNLFLVTGLVDFGGVQVDNQAKETVVTFNPGSILGNFDNNWSTAFSADNSTLTWERKNHSSGRGLIFVHDTNLLINTYSIKSVDSASNTITLRGVPDTPIDDNATFGLIYGQLIKQYIETPNSGLRAVTFFDPKNIYFTGGFVDTNDPPTGVCQVCHTISAYWHEDGTLVDPARVQNLTSHHSDKVCTKCHETRLGFKPSYVPHPWLISSTTTCANCHLTDEDGVLTEHGTCSRCHTSYPVLISSISGRSDFKWPTNGDPLNTGDCTDCHNGNVPGVNDIAGDFTNHPKALDDDDNSTNGFDGHAGQVTADTNCTLACHFHRNKDIITQIHTGVDSTTPIDPCVKCHELSTDLPGAPGTYDVDNTMTAKGTYTGSGKLQGAALAGSGDCANCHAIIETNFENHKNRNTHEGQVYETGTGECTRCHSGDPIIIVHKWYCGMCHDGLLNGGLKSLALEHGPGDCVNCHGSYFYEHDLSKFTTFFHQTGEFKVLGVEPAGSFPDCMECHNEGAPNPDLVYDIHSPIDLDPLYNHCANCHDNKGYLRGGPNGSAVGRGLNDTGFENPNICSTCHPAHLTDHPTHVGSGSGSEMNGFVLATDRCVSCHIGDRMKVVHNGDCLDCHESTFRDGIVNLVPGLPDPATYGNQDGHLDCIECHQALGNSFLAADAVNQKDHWKKGDHSQQVDGTPGCTTSCHAGDYQLEVHNNCTSCHEKIGKIYTGILIGSASGRGTGKLPIADNNCQTCHGDFSLHATSSAIIVTDMDHIPEIANTLSCVIAGCHTEIDFDDNATIILGLHDKNGCTTCHAPEGQLVGSASGKFSGGECIECHTTYFDGHQHGTNEHFVYQGTDLSSGQLCAACHIGSWSGILSEHTGGCTTCHSSTRDTLIDPAFGDANNDGNATVADIIYVGGSENYIYCVNCHTNATTYGSTTDPHPVP